MKRYPGRPEHRPPDWVEEGFKFHVRIRAEPGQNLIDAQLAGRLLDAAQFYHDIQAWWYSLFLLMPDHLHGIMIFPRNAQMSRVVGQWKHYTRHALGVRWQPNYFDSRLRTAALADDAWHYIRMNPVRAGLCAKPEDWPWRSELADPK